MSLKYTKTKDDVSVEKRDLKYSPIMRYIKNQEALRFNVGDILIKQSKWGNNDWETSKTGIGAPKKYMYVFENELGVGYIKQLKVDGSGFTSQLQCVANFDCDYTRLVLDPEYVDHMLIGEDEFKYNTQHAYKKIFRQEAISKNRKMCLNAKAKNTWLKEQVKVGDKFWYCTSIQNLIDYPYEVVKVTRSVPIGAGFFTLPYINVRDSQGSTRQWDENNIMYGKLSLTRPYPLEDPLCGHQK